MISNRVSVLRPSIRAAFARHCQQQWTRSVGRRGYATVQERVAQSSDRPWQIAALAVTIPGVIYLRRGDATKPSADAHGSHEPAPKHKEPPQQEPKEAEARAEPPSEAKGEEEQVSEQKAEGTETESASGSETEGAPTPSSASSEQSENTQLDDSQANQDQKLADKQPSQRVDPTQK